MKYLNVIAEWYHRLNSRDRQRIGIGIALFLLLAIIFSTANSSIGRLKTKLVAREGEIAEMLVLKQRYLEANSVSRRFANRLAATKPDDSPAKIIEEIGIKGKASQIRPIKGEERGGYQEDAAEVKIEGLTANETVNLLFKLEHGSRPVIIKSASLKTRFDDPSRLDITLNMALLKSGPLGRR
jgi:general secretion pathway protein M